MTELPSDRLFVSPSFAFCRAGAIPEELGQLTTLVELDMRNNMLAGKPLEIAHECEVVHWWLVVYVGGRGYGHARHFAEWDML